jgi:hypothetical protein
MREVVFMSDKNTNKKGKKLTKKELKAINHQKLMESKKGTGPTSSNVIEVNFNKDKKAA